MNIFALHPDPAIAASMHCDQHLHKMILESAQMLSTVARHYMLYLDSYSPYYKLTHQNHPCNEWLRESKTNCEWLVNLCRNLDSIRLSAGAQDTHASMAIVDLFEEDILHVSRYQTPKNFIFCGPLEIKAMPSAIWDVHKKYQRYYREKLLEWRELDRPIQMSYKGRPVPEFIEDLISA